MQRSLIVIGAFAVLIGVGFVCPQIASLRESGALITEQVLLLGLGTTLAAAGVIVGGRAAGSLVLRRSN